MDKDEADFDKVVDKLGAKFSIRAVPVALPVGSGASFKGVVDLLKMKYVEEADRKIAYKEIPGKVAPQAQEARAKLVEAAAEGDDELMMKFLEDELRNNERSLQKSCVADVRDASVYDGARVEELEVGAFSLRLSLLGRPATVPLPLLDTEPEAEVASEDHNGEVGKQFELRTCETGQQKSVGDQVPNEQP